jgi:FtsZ-binding cell division protein ZapB
MEQTKTYEVLEQLEKRISQAVENVTELRDEKITLETKIEELKKSNIELSEQINNLKIKHEKYASSFNREEVRKKIDHMLEKFGELQL